MRTCGHQEGGRARCSHLVPCPLTRGGRPRPSLLELAPWSWQCPRLVKGWDSDGEGPLVKQVKDMPRGEEPVSWAPDDQRQDNFRASGFGNMAWPKPKRLFSFGSILFCFWSVSLGGELVASRNSCA